MVPMTGISVASNAIQNSLPGGIVLYAAYLFRQYRRFGADDILAGWTLVAANALSFVTLAALAAVGLGLALGAGSALDLVQVILGIVMAAALIVLVWAERYRLLPHMARAVRLSQRLAHRPSPNRSADEIIDGWLIRVSAISPDRTDWAWATWLSLGNWAADCACLALCFLAVGAGVPWRGPAPGVRRRSAGRRPAHHARWAGRGRRQPDGRTGHLWRRPGLHRGRCAPLPAHLLLAGAAGGLGLLGGVGAARPEPPARPGSGPSVTGMTRRNGLLATVVASALVLGSCGTARPGISNGSVSACYRAIPAARAALRSSHASLVGVHRVPADSVRGKLPPSAQTQLAADDDTTVCALSFRGTFMPGQVSLAPPDEKGRYAVVLVTSRHLDLLASVVLDQLPPALGKRTL